MKKHLYSFILFFVSITFLMAETVSIRIATSLPEGSAWVNCLRNVSKELEAKIGVRFIIYTGGTAGEYEAIYQKIKYGQLDGIAVSGSGLGKHCSALRALELPYMYASIPEWNYVFKKVRKDFVKDFKKAGFVVVGWAHGGFAHIFSRTPISTLKQFRAAKVWAYPGDPLMEACLRELKVSGVPLGMAGVVPSLQTGLIDCVYNSSYGLIAMQWHTNIKYCTHSPIANPLGAILVSKRAFLKVPPQYRKLFFRIPRKHFSKLNKRITKDNEKAVEDLKKRYGVKFLKPDAQWIRETKRLSKKIAEDQVGKLYSRKFLEKVRALQKKYRNKKKKK